LYEQINAATSIKVAEKTDWSQRRGTGGGFKLPEFALFPYGVFWHSQSWNHYSAFGTSEKDEYLSFWKLRRKETYYFTLKEQPSCPMAVRPV
jgi:hypothetical protein